MIHSKRYLLSLLIGFAAGFLFIHPLTMIISEFFHWHLEQWHLHWYEIPNALWTAYSFPHLPNAIVYGVLTALVFFFWVKSNNTYRHIAEQSERFALIGREASTIVHDINNPLIGINAFVKFIKEGLEDEEKLDYCVRIESSADHISGLVAEIKTLAIGNGRMAIKKELILLSEFTRRIAREIHLRVKMNLDASVNSKIPIDKVYFSRVLLNILKNADDAMKGQENASISISLHASANRYTIQIADNGPGIPVAIRKNLFKFGVTYGKPHGSGLGLYTARRIVETHGGSISYRDRPGGGTIFLIELPAE